MGFQTSVRADTRENLNPKGNPLISWRIFPGYSVKLHISVIEGCVGIMIVPLWRRVDVTLINDPETR